MHSHIADAFAEWIGRSAHFRSSSLTARGRTTTRDGHTREVPANGLDPWRNQSLPVQANESTSSGSSQLVGGIPMLPEAQEGATELENAPYECGKATPTPSQKPNLLREEEEEEVNPHLPLQNGQEEQTQTTILRPVSLVKVAGIGDAGGQRGD